MGRRRCRRTDMRCKRLPFVILLVVSVFIFFVSPCLAFPRVLSNLTPQRHLNHHLRCDALTTNDGRPPPSPSPCRCCYKQQKQCLQQRSYPLSSTKTTTSTTTPIKALLIRGGSGNPSISPSTSRLSSRLQAFIGRNSFLIGMLLTLVTSYVYPGEL